MPTTGNSIDTNILATLSQRAGPQVTSAIRQASLKTGVDFAYLMEKAAAESGFDSDAQAKTSSARGLYQFIESTWLQMVDRYGEKHGLGNYADKISSSGKVNSPAMRKEILALRDNPEISALMAGEFAAENREALVDSGIAEKDIGSTELYLAHFLGAGAASEFIKAMQENPLTPAADLFPRAAKANRTVFFNPKTQEARSLGEIHAFFDKKFEGSSVVPAKSLVAEAKPVLQQHSFSGSNGMRMMATAQNNAVQMQQIMQDLDSGDIDPGILALMGSPSAANKVLSGRASSRIPATLVSNPAALMMMAQMKNPLAGRLNE